MMNYQIIELKKLFDELFNKSKLIHNKLMKSTNKSEAISQIDIFELYSSYSNIKVFFAIETGLQHHELFDTLQAFIAFYNEAKETYIENDRNTSWLDSTFRIYEECNKATLLLLNG